jgi:tetratricopeptide (TPR) repeat protein
MQRGFLLVLRPALVAGAVMGGAVGIAAEDQRREPILIPGVQEPEEMRVKPFPTTKADLTASERMLGEALQKSDKSQPAALVTALNQILAKYPDFSDGYLMRAFALCDPGNDRTAIAADLNRALKAGTALRFGKTPIVSLLAAQAKMEYLGGNYANAMKVLEQAITSDLGKATDFTNSGEVKPEQTASSACVWTESDVNELVQRFPNDYRSHMFRGLYFSFFVGFNREDWIVTRALDNFSKASQSALPQLFKARLHGNLVVFNARLDKLGWNDAARDTLNAELSSEYTKALALDPNLLLALAGRADALFNLKQYQKAIVDYDRILSIDSQDKGAFHDRGLAKMQLGDHFGAISDFSSAIKIQSRDLWERPTSKSDFYESRAEAYMRSRQWDLAIRDLTTAISLFVGSASLLMNIDQFRAIYPEYKPAPNEAVARKLQQTFYPDLKYEDFAQPFFTRRETLLSFAIPDLYVKRADAYLKKTDWHRALIEFRRATNGFPNYADAIDRWREIGQMADGRSYIDVKTYDDTRRDSIKLWIKQSRGAGDATGPYELRRLELNCGARQIRTVSFANYDALGDLVGSREGGRWASIVPDTLGETLYEGACRAN